MSNRANLAYNMDGQVGIVEPVSSVRFTVLGKGETGVVLAQAYCSLADQISAARTNDGNPNCATGCMLICTYPGSSSVQYVNTSNTSVTWTAISTYVA